MKIMRGQLRSGGVFLFRNWQKTDPQNDRGRVKCSWSRVDRVRVYVDGRPAGEQVVCAASKDVVVDVPLGPGKNRVSIVAYDAEWQSEVMTDGVTGRLVTNRDTHAMAAAVADLFRDPAIRADLGAACRKRVVETMGPEAVLAKERQVYGSVVP